MRSERVNSDIIGLCFIQWKKRSGDFFLPLRVVKPNLNKNGVTYIRSEKGQDGSSQRSANLCMHDFPSNFQHVWAQEKKRQLQA